MTVADKSPYGTAHRDYLAGIGETDRTEELANQAWEIAAFADEMREQYGAGYCFIDLGSMSEAARGTLRSLLYELGHEVSINPKKYGDGWVLRTGSPPRTRRARQRPKFMDRRTKHG